MSRPDLLMAPIVAAVMVSNAAINAKAGPIGYALLLASAVALHYHRRAPRLVLAATTGLGLAYILAVEPEMVATTPALIALSSVVRIGQRPVAAVSALTLIVGMVAANLLAGQSALTAVKGGFLVMGWYVAAMAMGVALQQADERATEAERTREEAALRRAEQERLHIARELHDTLTHAISVIKVQAGVAVHLAKKRGEEVPASLLTIQEASGDAMRELRATLEALRDETVALARLPGLVERTRAGGQDVRLTVGGKPRPLPEEVEQAAYRIVQEALTNVTKHAGGQAAADVVVSYGSAGLVLQVDDDGPGKSDTVPGVGLTGMRERVSALGGTLAAGPRPGGGFSVRAELPA
ncbi:sensor histidine kinase [Nonomuraea typhae]|uniref:sensor histidine kinase n=1 Tax=Nonomuraea typhae TaxID=2603600 RepID=UPI0012FCD761|nr:sensor histidine kinase [Nonomuraea typhae]